MLCIYVTSNPYNSAVFSILDDIDKLDCTIDRLLEGNTVSTTTSTVVDFVHIASLWARAFDTRTVIFTYLFERYYRNKE